MSLATTAAVVASVPSASPVSPAAATNPYDSWLTYTIMSNFTSLTNHAWVVTELPGFSAIVASRTFTEVQEIEAVVFTGEADKRFFCAMTWDGVELDLATNPLSVVAYPHHLAVVSTAMNLGLHSVKMVLEQGESMQISPPPTLGKIPKITIRSPTDSTTSYFALTVKYRQGGPSHQVKQGFN
jgi:hypothetical protein